jgi:deoxyribonuclease-4
MLENKEFKSSIMLNIGCHLSVSKGYKAMGEEALKIGANTFQFFTRNPRGSKAKEIDPKDVDELLEIAKENKFATILAHAPYTLNACSADEGTREFAMNIMADDLKRMEYLPNSLYNFHPGSHVKQGAEVGIEYIINMLNTVLKPEQTTTVLLETMSGKGTEVGRSFEELKQLMVQLLQQHCGLMAKQLITQISQVQDLHHLRLCQVQWITELQETRIPSQQLNHCLKQINASLQKLAVS